jgi:hypothetical protein
MNFISELKRRYVIRMAGLMCFSMNGESVATGSVLNQRLAYARMTRLDQTKQ